MDCEVSRRHTSIRQTELCITKCQLRLPAAQRRRGFYRCWSIPHVALLSHMIRGCSCIGGQSINRGHTSLHHERRSIVWLLRTGEREKWREIRNTKASLSEAADSSIPSQQLAPKPTWAYSSGRWTAYTAATHCALPAGPTAHCVHRTQRQSALLRVLKATRLRCTERGGIG